MTMIVMVVFVVTVAIVGRAHVGHGTAQPTITSGREGHWSPNAATMGVTMMDPTEPTLADDEAMLAAHAMTLADTVEMVVGDWIRWSIADRAPELAMTGAAERAVAQGSAEISTELRSLLAVDIADQGEAPLQVFRRGTRFATEVLREAGVATVARDDFAVRAFPHDVYDLAPASFADVHPSLHEPGLVWGAAKAHVHLRRRREQEAT